LALGDDGREPVGIEVRDQGAVGGEQRSNLVRDGGEELGRGPSKRDERRDPPAVPPALW